MSVFVAGFEPSLQRSHTIAVSLIGGLSDPTRRRWRLWQLHVIGRDSFQLFDSEQISSDSIRYRFLVATQAAFCQALK